MEEKIYTQKSRKTKSNIFADFILKKIGNEFSSIIHVTDCLNFFVINGYTNSNNFLDLNTVTKEFNQKFGNEYEISNTIDLIQYNVNLKEKESDNFKFYITSPNPSFNYKPLEEFEWSGDNIIYNGVTIKKEPVPEMYPCTSSFPHGFSLDQGRLLYYYSKFISYNLSGLSLCTEISINLSKEKNENGEYLLDISCGDDFNSEILKSYILDHFDFNYEKIKDEFNKKELTVETVSPLFDFDFVKRNISPEVLF